MVRLDHHHRHRNNRNTNRNSRRYRLCAAISPVPAFGSGFIRVLRFSLSVEDGTSFSPGSFAFIGIINSNNNFLNGNYKNNKNKNSMRKQ